MKQFFAILLAGLILFMNVGLTVSNHYCGGNNVESAFTFGHGDVGCGMEEEETPCEKNSHTNTVKKKDCCENQFLTLQVNDNYDNSEIENVKLDFKFVAAFVMTYFNFYSFNNSKKKEYIIPPPPLLDHDLQVMNQSFLI